MMAGSALSWEVVPTPHTNKPPVSCGHVPPQTTQLQPRSNSVTSSDLMFIKNLNPSEKSKIAFMIQQIVKLEQSCAQLTEELEKMKCKFEKKCVLVEEVEECLERLTSENEKLKAENKSQSQVLVEYSSKLEQTGKLLKTASSTNTRLQKRLNVKHHHVQIQTEVNRTSVLTQTVWGEECRENDTVQTSMNLFLTKLDTLCDKLSNVPDRKPAEIEENLLTAEPGEVVNVHNHKKEVVNVHNHKKEGELVCGQTNNPDLTYQAEESAPVNTIRQSKLKDSVVIMREDLKRRGEAKRKGEERQNNISPVRFNRQLFTLIDEIEDSQHIDENSLLNDLFFKVQ